MTSQPDTEPLMPFLPEPEEWKRMAEAPRRSPEFVDLNVWLDELWEFLDNQSDVDDGDYGIPVPNPAMRLLMDMERLFQRKVKT